MTDALRPLAEILKPKAKPNLAPSLAWCIQRANARQVVKDYLFTPSLREKITQVLEKVIHDAGQAFWVQAEYGAGKTHFLGTLINLLVWQSEKVWDEVSDPQLQELSSAMERVKLFPVAFSLRGKTDPDGNDSLMRVLESEIRAAIRTHAPALKDQIKLTSADLARAWYESDAGKHMQAAIGSYFQEEHGCTPEDYRSEQGSKKFGQAIVDSGMAEGRLKSQYGARLEFILEQIMNLGGYAGVLFVFDEFRSWHEKHANTQPAEEDEEILETLADVLPRKGLPVWTLVASQGDMPQKLVGGEGARFQNLLLADSNAKDFGEIVAFRCRELLPGGPAEVNAYDDACRKNYRFLQQDHTSKEYFRAVFPFQPRVFRALRAITQSSERHSLPSARSAIQIAWETVSDQNLLKESRLVTLCDLLNSRELKRGLQGEHYKDGYQGLETARQNLNSLELFMHEYVQAGRILDTLYLWGINELGWLQAFQVAEAAWVLDEDVGNTEQAETLIAALVDGAFPVEKRIRTQQDKEVSEYRYDLKARAEDQPSKKFAPLKKKAKQDTARQDKAWRRSLFWGFEHLTQEAQSQGFDEGGILASFDVEVEEEVPKLPVTSRQAFNSASLRVQYPGQVVIASDWRSEYGQAISEDKVHYRVVYLITRPADQQAIVAELQDERVAVFVPQPLDKDTREDLADLLAAEDLLARSVGPQAITARGYAKDRLDKDRLKVLKHQLKEFRRGKILTQKGLAIPADEVFQGSRFDSKIAERLLEQSYDDPLFTPTDFAANKTLKPEDAAKVFRGFCWPGEPSKAQEGAIENFARGLELALAAAPKSLDTSTSQVIQKIKALVANQDDLALSQLKKELCCAPYGLTREMVFLYSLILVREGGYQIAISPQSNYELASGQALPNHTISRRVLHLCKWNAQLIKALHGARLSKSTEISWGHVLPWARVLDDDLKPAHSNEEEIERGAQLLVLLAALNKTLTEIKVSLPNLAAVLETPSPSDLTSVVDELLEVCAVDGTEAFYEEVRRHFPPSGADEVTPFREAYDRIQRASRLAARGLEIQQIAEYLRGASDQVEVPPDHATSSLLDSLDLEKLLQRPEDLDGIRTRFEAWQADYRFAYQKAHRTHYEQVAALRETFEPARLRGAALEGLLRLEGLGPPLVHVVGLSGRARSLTQRLEACEHALEAAVDERHPLCGACQWSPPSAHPTDKEARLRTDLMAAYEDRRARLRDDEIRAILLGAEPGIQAVAQAAEDDRPEDMRDLLTVERIAVINALMRDENVQELTISLGPMIRQLGAIEADSPQVALQKLSDLIEEAIALGRQGLTPGKRGRVFLSFEPPQAKGGDP